MPFRVIRKDNEWIVENAHTHDIKGHHGQDKAKAERQVRALYANAADTRKKAEINPQLLAAFLRQMAGDTNEFKITPKDVLNNQLLSAILPDVATQNAVLSGRLRLDPSVNGGSAIQNAIHRSMLIDSFLQRYPESLAALDPKLLELLALEQALTTQQAIPSDIGNNPSTVEDLIDQLALLRSL